MPEISRFHGIVITMYHNEHGAPHFHAVYAGQRTAIDIHTGSVRGPLPPPTRRLVLEWLSLHRRELLDNWELARRRKLLRPVAPVE